MASAYSASNRHLSRQHGICTLLLLLASVVPSAAFSLSVRNAAAARSRSPQTAMLSDRHPPPTVSKALLVQRIAEETGVSKKQVAEILGVTLDVIVEKVSGQSRVSLPGFGTFSTKERSERAGRNPKTGEKLTIPAATVPAFSFGKNFKEAVKQSRAAASPEMDAETLYEPLPEAVVAPDISTAAETPQLTVKASQHVSKESSQQDVEAARAKPAWPRAKIGQSPSWGSKAVAAAAAVTAPAVTIAEEVLKAASQAAAAVVRSAAAPAVADTSSDEVAELDEVSAWEAKELEERDLWEEEVAKAEMERAQ